MRRSITSKQLKVKNDIETDKEQKKLLGQQKYNEWLDLQKHGQYLSKSKGEPMSLPKQQISMHEAPFDTIRKNRKSLAKSTEDIEIDLTIEGKKLDTINV